jgi:hypothetical protein
MTSSQKIYGPKNSKISRKKVLKKLKTLSKGSRRFKMFHIVLESKKLKKF